MRLPVTVLTLLLVPAALTAGESYALEPALLGMVFTRPLWVDPLPGTPDTLVVGEQGGRILAAAPGTPLRTLLDLVARTRTDATNYSEEGLLSVAFHPGFPTTRRAFVYWNPRGGARRTRLSEFAVAADGTFDPGSEKVLLEIPQPFGNHNGGDLRFGPDGMLYLGVGDGGAAGDPENNGQRLDTLLGAVLRLDVSVPGTATAPPDNPFVGVAGARPEIWAWGLRNPWRMSFDAQGRLWTGDVGQNAREEIDLIVRGGNYGWKQMEGFIPYKGGTAPEGAIPPVIDYGRNLGQSVTGGFVVTTDTLPALKGTYVFGDWASGRIWSIPVPDPAVAASAIAPPALREVLASRARISSFGRDAQDRILVVDHQGGSVLRLITRP